MKKSTLIFLFSLAALASILGIGKIYFLPKYNARVQEQLAIALAKPSPTPASVGSDEESSISAVLAAMTPADRVSQLLAFPLTIEKPGAAKNTSASESASTEELRGFSPGFVTIFGEAIASSSAKAYILQITSELTKQSSVGVLPAIAVDHEGGSVQRLSGKGFTKLPSWKVLCDGVATEAARLATQSATELHEVGVDVIFGPVVDVGNNPTMKTRICSEDAKKVSAMSESWVSSFIAQGITPVIKHYPGIGKGQLDLHQEFESLAVDAAQQAIFSELLADPAVSVMSSHQGDTIPCSLDAKCLAKVSLLPTQLFFTDALEMKAASLSPSQKQQALELVSIEAVRAGNQVLVFGKSVQRAQLTQVFLTMKNQYEKDEKFRGQVDEAVKKILRFKQQKGLLGAVQ